MSLKQPTKRHILIIFLIFFVLTTLRILWLAYFLPDSDQPMAQNGFFDVRNHVIQDKQFFHLNGEWGYYPEEFIEPKSIEQYVLTSNDKKFLPVPTPEKESFTQKYGTYHLKILLNENSAIDKQYAIKIPAIQTASALYVDGKLLGQSGKVGDSATSHKGQAAPYTVYFSAEDNEIDLILLVSNFDTPADATIDKRIVFSTAEKMMQKQRIVEISLTIISVILVLYAIFSILVYLFIYRKKIVLLFTAGFLLPLADELITYDRSILDVLQLNYVWSLKVSNLIYLGASFFFVHFMSVLLIKYRHAKCFYWFTILYGISALLIVILPIEWLYSANIIFFILYLASFIFVAALALREYVEKQNTSAFIVLTLLSTTSGILWGLIKLTFILDIPFYPFDYVFAFLGFSGYWFKRYYNNTQQINALIADLQKADQLKDEFLLSSSKKLWDPMNKMITLAQSIFDNPNNSLVLDDRNNLKNIIDVGRSMSFTLNDILDFTRLKEENIHLHKKNVNIHSVISGVFDMLQFITDGKQIQMTSAIPRSFPLVVADENRLIQILFNLLHNAIKYTSAGYIEIDARIENNMAVIHIKDTGLGMDDAIQDRLFSPYEQGDISDNGMGLGLFVSKQLIELHSGTLQIHSVLNKGSDVYFTLPLAKETFIEVDGFSAEHAVAESVQAFTNLDDHATERQFRILIIDDDAINLTIIKSIFASEEYEIVTVTSSERALELLKLDSWDLVIVDAMLPFISGYALIQMIREHYSVLELPILLLTARNYPEDVYTGFAYGANDYVTKPINSLELKVRSRALIDLKYNINQRLYLETAWLQAQIQPHFLFNTLNTIASLSTIDSERMIELLHHFGDYLHASFDVKNLQRVVPLKHELDLVRSYLYIEQQRFEGLLQIEWDIEKNIIIDIPPISLQTLVENAVRHGVLKKECGGTVCIRIQEHTTYVEISVIDDGIGIDSDTLSELLSETNQNYRGVGLRNTDLRLKRIYGQRLQIQSIPNVGTTITFHIPKK